MDAASELRRLLLSLNASQEEDLAVYYMTQLQEFMANIHCYFNTRKGLIQIQVV